jgi:hypothetical protein
MGFEPTIKAGERPQTHALDLPAACSMATLNVSAPSVDVLRSTVSHLLKHMVYTLTLKALPHCTVARARFNGHLYRPITKEAEEWVNTFCWCDLQIYFTRQMYELTLHKALLFPRIVNDTAP